MPRDSRIELNGRRLDAAIALEPGAITLESRGGTGAYARNSQYSAALETCSRPIAWPILEPCAGYSS